VLTPVLLAFVWTFNPEAIHLLQSVSTPDGVSCHD
jgi:hypothetical protein